MHAVLLLAVCLSAAAQSLEDLSMRMPVPAGRTVAIGFLGGFDGWNNPQRGVRSLALRLRENGLEAETFSNFRLRTAQKAILKALDSDRNGRIDAGEAASARVILYGQSLGGGAALKLARFLSGKKVPVLLTVQVDSVGLGDGTVPANVRSAINFYQHEWLTIRGETQIRAADPSRTTILGNVKYEYPIWLPYAWPESWPRRILGGGHARMESDPLLWTRIEGLILQAAHSPTQ